MTRRVVDPVRLRDEAPSGERLDAPVAPAAAAGPFERDRDVADLTGGVGGAAQQMPIDDESAADPGRDRHVDEIARALRGAGIRFPDGGHDRVSVDVDLGEPERARKTRPQRVLDEAHHVGRLVDDAASVIERARRRACHRGDVANRRIDRGARCATALRDRGDHVVGSRTRRGPLVASDDARDRPVVACDDAADVRAAEIDADVVIAAPHLRPATAR